MNRVAGFLACAAIATSVAAPAAQARTKKYPAGDPATKSMAVTDEVLDAMAAEISRSMVKLRAPGAPPPYFIFYKVTEVEVNDAVGSLGAVAADNERHFVSIEAHVHVGKLAFDNSNFVIPRRENVDGVATIQLPLEATADIAQRSAWLVTDAAYKEAIEQLAAKEDALRGHQPAAPSFSTAKANVKNDPVLVPQIESVDSLRERAAKISATFRGQPHIRDSRVALTSYIERRWIINSEGTSAQDTRRVSGVVVVASAFSDDGEELVLYRTDYGVTAADLPTDAELTDAAKDLSSTLAKLQHAPLTDPYTGPVLFEGAGAAGMVRETLAGRLGGTPLPLGISSREAQRFGERMVDRVGLKILAKELSVTDDPTTWYVDGHAVIGGFQIDDQGVPSQKIKVIDRGVLKSLLMSRTPSKAGKQTNGHARRVLPGGVFHGSATNLIVSARGGKSRRALERQLLHEVKHQGLPYGIIIRRLDDPAISASTELARSELFRLLQARDPEAPPPALIAVRIYPNGKEELVRGVQLKPVPLRAWRHVIGTSKKTTVLNFLASIDDPALVRLGGGGLGAAPSGGIESSVTTPDLLFEELDIEPANAGRRPPPPVPAP